MSVDEREPIAVGEAHLTGAGEGNQEFRRIVADIGTRHDLYMVGEQGRPCRLTDGGAVLQPLPDSCEKLGGVLLRHRYVQLTAKDGTPVLQTQRTKRELGAAVLEMLDDRTLWRRLDACVSGPLFEQRGARMVRARPGYDGGRLILEPRLPQLPTPAPGYPHLHKLFSGLEFVDPVYHANLLGTVVALFCRTGMEAFPILLLDADQKSSGKTVTAQTLSYLLSGEHRPAITYSGNEEEFERRLGGYSGRPGPNLIVVDNVRAKRGQAHNIRSQCMSSAVHTHIASARKLYEGCAPLFDPIFLLTMNGARVEGDLGDKAMVLSLRRPPSDQVHRPILPWPIKYAAQYRMELLAEIYQIIDRMELVNAGRLHTRFYLFEQIVTAAARELGLDASFDPARVRTVDACIHELLDLVHDTCADKEKISMREIISALRENPAIRELNEVRASFGRAGNGEAPALREYLLNTVHNKTVKWKGKVVSLAVDGDLLTLAPQA